MSDVDLARLIADLQQGDNQTADMWKKVLCEVVNKCLQDLDRIAEHASKKQSDSTLDLLAHVLHVCPELFVVLPQSSSSDTPKSSPYNSTNETEEEKKCYEVSCWVMCHLLRVLSHPGCHAIHAKSHSLLPSLLSVIKPRDPYLFWKLVSELVFSLGDLAIIHEELYETSKPEQVAVLRRFTCPQDVGAGEGNHLSGGSTSSTDVSLNMPPICLTGFESCELLQAVITKVLCEMSVDVCQFALEHTCLLGHSENQGLGLLWASLGCQLEYGEVYLKKVTLDLCQQLLAYQGMPQGQCRDYFINCVAALVLLLCSGPSDVQGDFDGLESSLKACLQAIINILDSSDFELIKVDIVESLLESMSDSIIIHGLASLRTDSLRTTICSSIFHLTRLISQSMTSGFLFQDKRYQVTCKLIKDLGTQPQMQYCVACLQQSVLLDVKLQASRSSVILGEPSTAEKEDKPETLTASRSQASSGGESSGIPKASTLALLRHRLDELCTGLQQQILLPGQTGLYVSTLEGLRVLVEVVIWCVAHQDLPDNKMDLGDWLAASQLRTLCAAWKVFLQSPGIEAQPDLSDSCLLVVQTVGALMSIQEVSSLSNEVLHTCAWILSLPWMQSEMSWLDLKPACTKDIAQISSAIADKLDSRVVTASVYILALLPKEVASQWRIHVLKLAIGDTHEEVRAAAVRAFPFLLYHCGPSTNHLVYDILQDVLGDHSESVLIQLAQILGPLACVVSRKATLTQPSELNMEKKSFQHLSIQCVTCNNKLLSEGKEMTDSQGRPRLVDPNMFLPFMKLLSSNCLKVRLAMVESLGHLFCHIGVRSNNTSTVKLLNMCLGLLLDPEYVVRHAFSNIIQHLVGKDRSDKPSQSDETIVSHLKMAAKQAKESNNTALMETILLTMGQLGRVAESDLLLVVVVCLVESACSPNCLLAAAVAHKQLEQLAIYKGIKMKQLFRQFGRRICMILVEHMHEVQQKGLHNADPMEKIGEVAQLFEFEDTKAFMQQTEQFVLPHLVKKASSTASQLIRIISKALGDPNHKVPLFRNTRYIFCHLVCSCQSDELWRTFSFLEAESEYSLGVLLRAGQNLDSELLLHLGTHYEQVLTGIKLLNLKLGNFQGDVQEITDEALANLLQPKLLGILVHFDNHLNNATVPLEEKKEAFLSVISLMRLMGQKHITAVRVRVMTTLKIGLNLNAKHSGFADLCCRAWNCFVHSVETLALGPMLSQIVINLQPLLYKLPKQVTDILYFIIVENRMQLNKHFHELYFLPDLPELADVNAVLKKYVEGSDNNRDLRTQLELLLKGITHESLDVRQLALSKLTNLFRCSQAELHKLVLGSETVDPIICQVATALLAGSRESDKSVHSLYGECLGELGAIDPGRLELMGSRTKEEQSKFLPNVTDDHFAFELINELAKAFLRAEDRNTQDCVAFSIQELIQVYEITDEGGDGSGSTTLWRRFSPEVQERMEPFMRSKYKLTNKPEWGNLPKPIYRSRKGKTFSSWVCTLTGYLGSQVRSEKARRVFESCQAVIKNDAQIALYLLPHVTVQVLLDGPPPQHRLVREEILQVLNHVKEDEGHHGNASDLCHMSAQTVFSMLDHLTKWTRHRVMVLSYMAGAIAGRARGTGSNTSDVSSKDPGLLCIRGFLDQIPQDVLASASQSCGAYTRALMHFEQFIKRAKQENSHENLDFIQKLYASLDEPDGVAGITSIKQTQPTLSEQIRAFESTGQLSDASVCYDRAIQLEPADLGLRQGLLRCRLSLGELHTASDLANGMIAARHQWSSSLNEYRVEAAWRLGQWDKLPAFLKKEKNSRSWSVGVARLLMAVKSKDEEDFSRQLKTLRSDLMVPLSAASMEVGSYHRGYQYIVRLHMLNELEEGVRTLLHFPDVRKPASQLGPQTSLQALLNSWEARLQLVQSSFRTCEPILNLRRTVLGLVQEHRDLGVEKEIGQCWLQTARVARKCGLVQTAHSSLLSASAYNLPEFCLENAKWLWDRGDYDKAQSCLEKAIEEHYPDRSQLKLDGTQASRNQCLACAKAVLLVGRYSEETASLESNAIMRQYREVMKVNPQWEDGYFYTAKYYDKLMTTLIETDRPEKKGEFVIHVVMHLLQSLKYGNQYIYQSMPRLLTLWLDYGAELKEHEKKAAKNDATLTDKRSKLDRLNKYMSQYGNELQPYQFLTAFPQLISRICHAHAEVFTQLKEIIARLLVVFPQQTMWMMMAVSKSTYTMRVKRCQEIFSRAKSLNMELSQFLQDATKLTDRLLDLCNRQVDTSGPLSISQHFKPLQRLLDDQNFCPILLPLQSLMTPTLPCGLELPSSHEAFPVGEVHIQGIEDTVEVLPSLQKPKKITLQGSDGKLYVMLCKPKDDLRKDARLMEFNAIVNKCLRKDPESRRRDLHIRTYTVTPLNEECGLLEWVSNTTGYRNILLKLYKERGSYTSGKELRNMQVPVQATLAKKLDMYKNQLLAKHPAVFGEWFLKTFPDPTSWYNARLAYARTAAVMSMVGYILGLGDRHGENILLDSTNGDCLHVDFNCLFNKGETFDYPEIVPFRLTHNMVEAMGPTGHEGVFRRACEVTLRVMRDQCDPLMSVLKTFVYDPLVEWSKPARGRSAPTDTGEIKNEKAFTHVNNIESRLKGILKNKTKPRGLPLSVEGHVNHLIKEATDENNLCQMYIGWAAYM